MTEKRIDFPLQGLKPTLRRLRDRNVPHAARLLAVIEANPGLSWRDLDAGDRAIIQGWSLHLVGLLNRLHIQLQRVKAVVVLASDIEKSTPHLTGEDLLRLAEHHSQRGDGERANAFRLAAALRTPPVSRSSH
jgi:hypothetical protein